MSEEQLKAFMEMVKNDAGLAASVKVAKSIDEVISLAKAKGFDLDKSLVETVNKNSLSDAELESVAGGGEGNLTAPSVLCMSIVANTMCKKEGGFC